MSYIQLEHLDLLSQNLSHVTNSVSGAITTILTDTRSLLDDVARVILNSLRTLTSNIPWHFAILLLPLFAVILRALYQAYATTLRDTPGPWQAKFTRLWLLRAISSRSFQKINLDLHRKYGPIVRIAPNEYSIDDPQSAKIIYRSGNQLMKSPRYSAWGVPTNEQNTFSAQDISRHAERRKQTAPLYQWNTLFNFEPQLDALSEEFLGRISDLANSGEVTELNHWFHYYALDAIAIIALGKPFGLLRAGGDVAGLMATVQRYSRYGAIVGVYPELHPSIFRLLSLFTPKGAYGLGYLVEFMNGAIAGESSKKGRFSDTEHHFVRMLYAMHMASPEKFTHDDIRFHIVPSIGGGSDTTAITFGAVIYHLIKSPSVMHRLRRELDEKREKREMSWPVKLKEAQECVYLQAVVKETMRLYPGNGLPLPRIVSEGGLTLANHHFPAGTIVGINAWVANFNKDVYGADAMIFRPERWLDSSPAQIVEMDNYFLTFGKGPRTCLGKNISLLEISKLIPMLVLSYDFSLAGGPGAEWTLLNDWFVRQKDYRVRVSRRKEGGGKEFSGE